MVIVPTSCAGHHTAAGGHLERLAGRARAAASIPGQQDTEPGEQLIPLMRAPSQLWLPLLQVLERAMVRPCRVHGRVAFRPELW